jgi:hypothetical protein
VGVGVGVGGGATNVYVTASVVVPFGVTTLTLTDPAACAGKTAVIDVRLITVRFLSLTPPRRTAVAHWKCAPVRVTVPPVVGPFVGLRLVSVGPECGVHGAGVAATTPEMLRSSTPRTPGSNATAAQARGRWRGVNLPKPFAFIDVFQLSS